MKDYAYTSSDLLGEIREVDETLSSESGVVTKGSLVSEVMARHSQVFGGDRDFALYCSECYVADEVDQYIRKRKRAEKYESEEQLEIEPGWKRLQQRYVLTRSTEIESGDGSVQVINEQAIVNLESMTEVECALVSEKHRKWGQGHFEHADEIDAYSEAKFGS